MKIAIMQPYFFPYLGYWQMFNAVEKFVLLDDVKYIKQGYINRNSILINGQASLFTISVYKPNQELLIKDVKMKFSDFDREKLLKKIEMAYKKAPFFDEVFSLLSTIILNETDNITLYIKNSFEKISEYLGLKTEIIVSSELNKDSSLTSKNRIIEIIKTLGASEYINAIGGQELYNKQEFSENGIKLNFIKMKQIEYKQGKYDFVPNLSFIDVLMNNSVEKILELLEQYELV